MANLRWNSGIYKTIPTFCNKAQRLTNLPCLELFTHLRLHTWFSDHASFVEIWAECSRNPEKGTLQRSVVTESPKCQFHACRLFSHWSLMCLKHITKLWACHITQKLFHISCQGRNAGFHTLLLFTSVTLPNCTPALLSLPSQERKPWFLQSRPFAPC